MPSDDTLRTRIAELDQAIESNEQVTVQIKRHGKLVPRSLLRTIAKQQRDLSWLKELDGLRDLTRGIISGDHEAISRGLFAALDKQLLLKVTHTLLMHHAKKRCPR